MLRGCVPIKGGDCKEVCTRCRSLCVAGFWQYLVESGCVSIAMIINASSRTDVFRGEGRCLLVDGGGRALSSVASPLSRFPLSRSPG
jgi:hypothetical protein